MAKENENLESTEETVEQVVADKDAEQEHLDRQKEEEESIALASAKAKEMCIRDRPSLGELKYHQIQSMLFMCGLMPLSTILPPSVMGRMSMVILTFSGKMMKTMKSST